MRHQTAEVPAKTAIDYAASDGVRTGGLLDHLRPAVGSRGIDTRGIRSSNRKDSPAEFYWRSAAAAVGRPPAEASLCMWDLGARWRRTCRQSLVCFHLREDVARSRAAAIA